jgi:hypothetical protein
VSSTDSSGESGSGSFDSSCVTLSGASVSSSIFFSSAGADSLDGFGSFFSLVFFDLPLPFALGILSNPPLISWIYLNVQNYRSKIG